MLERVLANWPLKLLSVALALAMWVFVTGERRIPQDFSVPLDIRLPDSRILTEAPPNTVTVRLRGAESLIRRLDRTPMEIAVDLEDPPLGEQEVQLSKSDIDVPPGVEVDFIKPDRVTLSVDKRARRELTVEPTFLGQPPEGYAFYGVKVVPEKLTVEGPESEVIALQKLNTNPIRLDQRTRPFRMRVQAVPGGRAVRVVDALDVEVRVDVDGAPVERSFENVPVELVGQVYESVVSPGALDVTLSGPPSLVERLESTKIRLVADVTGLAPQARPHSVSVIFDLVDVPVEEMTRINVKSISRRKIAVRVTDRRYDP